LRTVRRYSHRVRGLARCLVILLCVPLTAGLAPALAGQDDDRGAEPSASLPAYLERYSRPFVIDGREFTFTQKYYWHRLFHPEMKDRLRGAGVLMASFVLATQKNRIQADVAEDDSPPRERFFRQAQDFGGKGIVPAIAALFYVGGSAFHDYRAKETGFMLAESGLYTGILTVTGMWILSEDRPRDGGCLHPFQGIGHGVSGHAATAASVSGVLSRMYLQVRPEDGRVARTFKWIGKGFAYGAPVAVAFGRVNEQEHFVYSTVLGMAIGFWTSNAVADAHGLYLEGRHPGLKPEGVGPILGEGGGVGLGARWEIRRQ
jgi:PAP2 superfamily protein